MAKLVSMERISLKSSKDVNEKMIQEYIFENPSCLGLGELTALTKEKSQPAGGRLDLLMADDNNVRYEIEIQLGETDPSHIIRTIEYWDTERKRYQKYDHVAVIVAEEITGRFMNVIQLFNGNIPIVALQLAAYKMSDGELALVFTKVLDQITSADDDEEEYEATDRKYWEVRTTKEQLKLVDAIFEQSEPLNCFELKYNKFYIGLTKNGIANNPVIFRPRKNYMAIDTKKEQERDELHRAIWAIADELRGAVDGWDFKNYVLGTMFYRYISENLTNYVNESEIEAGTPDFDYAALTDEEAAEAKDGLIEAKGFFILPSELFCNVQKRAASDSKWAEEHLNEVLDKIFRDIEGSAKGSESESDFSGLFDDFDVNNNKLGSTVAKRNEKLTKLLTGVANMNLGNVKDHDIDAFGDAYEYLMSMYASNAGKSGGEFFTPADISVLLTRLGTVNKKEKHSSDIEVFSPLVLSHNTVGYATFFPYLPVSTDIVDTATSKR